MCMHEKPVVRVKEGDGELLIDGICSFNGLPCSGYRCPIAKEEARLYFEELTPWEDFDF